MTPLQAYLNSPRARRALSKKPGEEGFSLIELVVVVAVLAVLSAIAIPNFANISNKARASAASTTLATVVKECAAKIADAGQGEYVVPTLNGYTWNDAGGTSAQSGSRDCLSSGTYAALSGTLSEYPSWYYDVGTGAKTCITSGNTSNAASRGCPITTGGW